MRFKIYSCYIVGAVIVSLLCTLIVAYVVDPIGIWGTGDIAGFNNAKIKKGGYMNIYKPYECARIKPDVVWIGTSRVYVGFFPEEDANEYNMGVSSISLDDAKRYLRFIYSVNRPSKVYIGLDLFQFGPDYKKMLSGNLLDARLNAVKSGGLYSFVMALKDSFCVKNTIWPTVKRSRNDNMEFFLRGWDVKRGNAESLDLDAYYGALNSYRKTYDDFSYDKDAMNCFKDIVEDAKENGVELVVFFNPIAVDLQALQNICGLENEFYAIKREVATIHPVFDFCWINKYTVDRKKWFYDASHFRRNYGEMCRAAMDGVDNGTALYLTADNVDEMIKKERNQFTSWKNDNEEFYEALSKQSRQMNLHVGDFKKYIGF